MRLDHLLSKEQLHARATSFGVGGCGRRCWCITVRVMPAAHGWNIDKASFGWFAWLSTLVPLGSGGKGWVDWSGFHRCALLGFEGPNCFLLGMLLAVVVGGCFLCGGWVVFWPADHQRVVVVGWTGRTLRTTQWTRASSKTHELFLGFVLFCWSNV